jgi:hypothetical protein
MLGLGGVLGDAPRLRSGDGDRYRAALKRASASACRSLTRGDKCR